MNENFWWGFGLWVFIICVGVLVSTAVIDSGGRHEDKGQHSESLPAGVQQLSADSYIVPSKFNGNKVCGGDNRYPTVKNQATLAKIDGDPVYIQCRKDQTWNIRGDLSPNFTDGIVETATSPIFWGLAGGSLILFLLPGTIEERKYLKQRKYQRKQFKLSFPKKKEALENAWARDEITDLTYENKLQKLLDEEHK